MFLAVLIININLSYCQEDSLTPSLQIGNVVLSKAIWGFDADASRLVISTTTDIVKKYMNKTFSVSKEMSHNLITLDMKLAKDSFSSIIVDLGLTGEICL